MESSLGAEKEWDARRYEWWRGFLAALAATFGFIAATLVVAIQGVWDSNALPWIAIAFAGGATICLVGIPVLFVVEHRRLRPDDPLLVHLGPLPFAIVALCLIGFVIGGFLLPASHEQATPGEKRYAARLNSVLTELRRENLVSIEKLGSALTASGQQEAAEELGRSFGRAAVALQRIRVGNRLRRLRQQLVQRLEGARKAYGSLSRAAGPDGGQAELDAARSAVVLAMVKLRGAVGKQKRLVA